MGTVDGRGFLKRLDLTRPETWCGDKRITGIVSKHLAFARISKSVATLYDMQLRPELLEVMTFESSTTGTALA